MLEHGTEWHHLEYLDAKGEQFAIGRAIEGQPGTFTAPGDCTIYKVRAVSDEGDAYTLSDFEWSPQSFSSPGTISVGPFQISI